MFRAAVFASCQKHARYIYDIVITLAWTLASFWENFGYSDSIVFYFSLACPQDSRASLPLFAWPGRVYIHRVYI